MKSENLYKALVCKDRRFDGRVFFAVRTTGVYCRPICPARTPLRKNVEFFPSAASAEEAGFRPCLRCRPESSPGTPAWQGSSSVVGRALRLIVAGEARVPELASKVGIGERQLRRLFMQHLGASPQTIIRTQRLDFARRLLDQTELPVSQIAFASGFMSLRRFNDAFRKRFLRSPSETRRKTGNSLSSAPQNHRLKLAYRPPLSWEAMLEFLGARAIPGVEKVEGLSYFRTLELGGESGWLEVRPSRDPACLELVLGYSKPSHLMEIVARVRRLFDLDADPLEISRQLSADPRLARLVSRCPGLRVPGAWDGFELAVRAVLGQQITVAGASTLAGKLAARFGTRFEVGREKEAPAGLSWLFPKPSVLANADLRKIGFPAMRARTLSALAARGPALEASADVVSTRAALLEIPGIGPWTADYVAMRALRDPDAFPSGDLILKRGLARLGLDQAPESWKPWRAYAALHLWRSHADKDL